MGRRRAPSRKNWPNNLYPNRNGFKYRHPDTGKETWFGRDKRKAFAAARRLNDVLAPVNDFVLSVLGSRTITLGQVDDFVLRVLGGRTVTVRHINDPIRVRARPRKPQKNRVG